MENENLNTEKVENPNTRHNEETVLPEIALKEQEIILKKKRFKLFIFSFVGIFLFFLISIGLFSVITIINLKNKQVYEKKEESIQTPVVNPTESWKTYDNAETKTKFKYPEKAKIIENKDINQKIRNVEVIYTPNGIDSVNESNLVEGYIFRLTPLELGQRTLEDIVAVKRESFSTDCGDKSEISSIRGSVIENLEAKTFDVRNCNGDFNVTYFSKYGIFFEISQIYRGDIGFRQQYMNTTTEILNTLTMYPEEEIEETPFKNFKNENYKISFQYPKELNTTCCTIDSPSENIEKVIILGTKQTEEKYGVIGIFAERKNSPELKNMNFNNYVQFQKNKLISDYKIVNEGKEPTIIEEQFNIGETFAIRFRGLSWKGNDVIYINTPSNNLNFFTISIINKIGKDFEQTIESVLDSMQFVVQAN